MKNLHNIEEWEEEFFKNLDVPFNKSKEDLLLATLAAAGMQQGHKFGFGSSSKFMWLLFSGIALIGVLWLSAEIYVQQKSNKQLSVKLIPSQPGKPQSKLVQRHEEGMPKIAETLDSQSGLSTVDNKSAQVFAERPKTGTNVIPDPAAHRRDYVYADRTPKYDDFYSLVNEDLEFPHNYLLAMIPGIERINILEFPVEMDSFARLPAVQQSLNSPKQSVDKQLHWMIGLDALYTMGYSSSTVSQYQEQREVYQLRQLKQIFTAQIYVSRRLHRNLFLSIGLNRSTFSASYEHSLSSNYYSVNDSLHGPGTFINHFGLIRYESNEGDYYKEVGFQHTSADGLVNGSALEYSLRKTENYMLTRVPLSLDYYLRIRSLGAFITAGINLDMLKTQSSLQNESIVVNSRIFIPESKLLVQNKTMSQNLSINPLLGIGCYYSLNQRWKFKTSAIFSYLTNYERMQYQITAGLNYGL